MTHRFIYTEMCSVLFSGSYQCYTDQKVSVEAVFTSSPVHLFSVCSWQTENESSGQQTFFTHKWKLFFCFSFLSVSDCKLNVSKCLDTLDSSRSNSVCDPLCAAFRRVAMMRNLLAPYEQRPWAQTNWILVRLWRVSTHNHTCMRAHAHTHAHTYMHTHTCTHAQ